MMLAVGSQRSYSDVCRLTGGKIVRAGNRILYSDFENGMMQCEAGVTLQQIVKMALPWGWFLKVTPGTQYATVGGCIANDVHGKNHVTAGSFGNHVLRFELVRSGSTIIVSRETMPGFFSATIGGLGLTGMITWAEIGLVRQPTVFQPYYYPLDYIPWYWPLYKRLGLLQYQCVVPDEAVESLLRQLTQQPFLMVRKRFGDIPSIGMLSFCRPGISFSFDLANLGVRTRKMLMALDNVVMGYGGAVYPAKYSMSQDMFRHSFPRWQEFSKYVDPEFSSDFWERVK